MTIMNTLSALGFLDNDNGRPLPKKTLWWGRGCVVEGQTAYVKDLGHDRYSVCYHYWYWDGGDNETDEQETVTLYGAQAIQYLVERLPLFRRRYWG